MTDSRVSLDGQVALLEPLPDAVFVVDLDDRVRFANAAARRLLGFGPEDVDNLPIEALLPQRARHADSAGGRIRALLAMRGSRFGTQFEVTARRLDSGELPVQVGIAWADVNEGTVALVTVRPIVDPGQSEAIQRLAAVVESSADAILTKDLDGVITSWNRGARRMYGYRAEEVVGRPVSMLMDAEHARELPGILAAIRRGEAVEGLETVRITKDGRHLDVSVTISPVRDLSGAIVGAATVARDITDRKRADEQVRALLESAPDAVIVLDEAGRMTLVNRRTEQLFGYARDELLGRPVQMLMPAYRRDEDPVFRGLLDRDGPMDIAFERPVRRADGSEFPAESTFSVLHEDGTTRVYASIRDITSRKRIEAELRRSNHDLEQFAYVASHDLSEPLRVIAGFVDLLAQRYRGKLDEDADRFIGFVVSGVERMQALIDDLLAYSRAGRVVMEPREIDAGAVVRDVLWGLEPQIEARGIIVEVGELPTVRAEKAMLRQILQNLIANAVKFSDGEPPRIEVTAVHDDDGWRFDVADNGPGVDPRYAERVFEMFQRLHGREVPGSGMGLAIVKRLTERHGGRVWVSAAQPRGSVFHFTLPDRPPSR